MGLLKILGSVLGHQGLQCLYETTESEYSELESTPKAHRLQLPSLHRTSQVTSCA